MSKKSHQALGFLTTNVPVINQQKCVADVKRILFDDSKDFATIHYTYILDEADYLVGVVSIKEALRTPDETPLTTFIKKNLVVVRKHTPAERVAHLAITHNIAAIPVLDTNKKFLGIVTADDIHDILSHEHTKDILQMAGVSSEYSPGSMIMDERPLSHLKARLPWLILGLGGGLAAAYVVGRYEEALSAHIVLAAFIPAIVYVADSVGSQTQMIFIRALAINQSFKMRQYVWREALVNSLLALILGSVIFIITNFWWQQWVIGVILGLSVFLTVLTSVIIAILLPYISQRLHKDPAIASGPLATVFRDILSLIIYLTIAGLFLPYL